MGDHSDLSLHDLFIRRDGCPMFFSMGLCDGRLEMHNLVMKSGGILLDPREDSHKSQWIRLASPEARLINPREDFFSSKYVKDCVAANTLLPNLTDYRINQPSVFKDSDPYAVLLGHEQWTKFVKRDDGDSGSTCSDFENEDFQQTFKKFKSKRTPYSRVEQMEILRYIVKNRLYNNVRGNSMWKEMERKKIGMGNRTWQSLKENFTKQIMPKLNSFQLSANRKSLLRRAFSGEKVYDFDEDKTDETSTDESEEKENDLVSSNLSPLSDKKKESDVHVEEVELGSGMPKNLAKPAKAKSETKNVAKDQDEISEEQMRIELETSSDEETNVEAKSKENQSKLFEDKKKGMHPRKKIRLASTLLHTPKVFSSSPLPSSTLKVVNPSSPKASTSRDPVVDPIFLSDSSGGRRSTRLLNKIVEQKESDDTSKSTENQLEFTPKRKSPRGQFRKNYNNETIGGNKPYTMEEDEKLIDAIKSNGYFSMIRGRAMWQNLEDKKVLPERSWQSMKNRFIKTILPRVGTDSFEGTSSNEEQEQDMMWKLNGKPYSTNEDKTILKFIIENRRQSEVRGVGLWKLMEEQELLPFRSWQSLKERFLKRILRNLDAYELSSDEKELLKQ